LKKILALITVLVAMQLITSTAIADNGGGPSDLGLDTQVGGVCGLVLTPTSVHFGLLQQDQTSGDQTTIVKNDGTAPTTSLEIQGADWSPASTPVTFPVSTTHYDESGSDYGSMTSLLTTPNPIHGGVLGNQASFTLHFKLSIPHGVTAAAYTQTITITSGC